MSQYTVPTAYSLGDLNDAQSRPLHLGTQPTKVYVPTYIIITNIIIDLSTGIARFLVSRFNRTVVR